jgi:glyoxylase-like metal-dependent hydrolase (beta-lactamase superfamily II)
MKKSVAILLLFFLLAGKNTLAAQDVFNKEVCLKNEDVEFKQIDEHTWLGYGHQVYNESIYLVEGNDKAVLIDAGTRIKDLDKMVAKLTNKPVMLVATHIHGDHTGSAIAYFPELYIGSNDTVLPRRALPNYKGKILFLKDGEVIDLGGRQLEVIYTPGHKPESITLIDKKAGYGFSGDSFGSGNLLLSGTISTLISTCEKTKNIMEKNGIQYFVPGHVLDKKVETKQRVADLLTLGSDILAGKIDIETNNSGQPGSDLIIEKYGVRLNFSRNAIK